MNVQIDTDINASCVPSFCFLRRPRSNETSVTLGTHSALNVSSKYPSSVGGARAAFQVIDSRAGPGTIQDEPDTS